MANAATLAGHVAVEDHAVIGDSWPSTSSQGSVPTLWWGIQRHRPGHPPLHDCLRARAKLFGLNTIGLKRHGFSDATIAELKKAYKILFRRSGR